MMMSVFPSASRYMLETMPNSKLRLLHLTFFFTHQKQCNFFFHEHMHLIVTTSLNSAPRDAQIPQAYAPGQLSFVQWHLTLTPQLLQFFSLTPKLCTITHAPSIKAPCNTKFTMHSRNAAHSMEPASYHHSGT
jgi:hypothetical protein